MRFFLSLYTCSIIITFTSLAFAERLEYSNEFYKSVYQKVHNIYTSWNDYESARDFTKKRSEQAYDDVFGTNSEHFLFELCHSTMDVVNYERARLHFNNKFNEIKSKEHEEDIKHLANTQHWLLKSTPSSAMTNSSKFRDYILMNDFSKYEDNCDLLIKATYEYDRKWFFHERLRQKKERKSTQRSWYNSFVQNSDDKFDTIINEHNIHIPRKYIASKPKRPDHPVKNRPKLTFPITDILDQTKINSIDPSLEIKASLKEFAFPLYGLRKCPSNYYDLRYCDRSILQMLIIENYMQCSSNYPEEFETYAEYWQKENCELTSNAKERYSDISNSYDSKLELYNILDNKFIAGDPKFPDYMLSCKKQRCSSEILSDKGILLKYYIPESLLPHHRHIHEGVTKLLNSFIGAHLPKT